MIDWWLIIFAFVMGFLGGSMATIFFVREVVMPLVLIELEKRHVRTASPSRTRATARGVRGNLFVVPNDDNALVPQVHGQDGGDHGKESI